MIHPREGTSSKLADYLVFIDEAFLIIGMLLYLVVKIRLIYI
jgi:hypothetical protein